jgi:hypothetical protein
MRGAETWPVSTFYPTLHPTLEVKTCTKKKVLKKLILINNLKGDIACFGGSEKSNRTDRIAEKSLFA